MTDAARAAAVEIVAAFGPFGRRLGPEHVDEVAACIERHALAAVHAELRAARALGERALDRLAVRNGVLASYCMTCGDVYRVVRQTGNREGGLSHGYCTERCLPEEWRPDAA